MSRDALSRDQMGHLLRDQPEGFSVKAYGPNTGEAASHGYMVATEGNGQDYAPKASVDQGMDFIASREGVLRQSGAYFGGYQGSEPERTALDVSEKYDPTFTGHVTAGHQAMALNQESYGRLREPTDYTDIPNPHYQAGAGHAHRAVSLDQMGDVVSMAHAAHPSEGIDSPAPSRSAALTKPSRLR